MHFSVATNFDDDLPGLVAPFGAAELFGKLTRDAVGGGRASYTLSPVSARRLEEHVRRTHEAGMGFNYLLNAACMDNREFTRAGQAAIRRLLDWLSSIEVDSVTVSTPFMLQLVKRRYPHFRVKMGVFAAVDTPRKARFVQDLGADCIAIQPLTTIRNFPRLRAIREAVKCELQLIANSNCLLECPMTPYHNVGLSHASQGASRGFFIDYCVLKCLVTKLEDPVNYIKSPWIRPEDTHYYEEIGYKSFKILERDAPTETLLARVKAYHDRLWEGNLFDLVQSYGFKAARSPKQPKRRAMWELREFLRPRLFNPKRLLPLKELAKLQGMIYSYSGDPDQFYLDNRKLDGFLSRFVEQVCVNLDCDECRYCHGYADKALRIGEEFRGRSLALANQLLEDMSSGRMWGAAACSCSESSE